MKTITLTIPDWDSDDVQTSRVEVGEAIMRALEDITGAEREVAFTDLVSYMLHAEMYRVAASQTTAPTIDLAAQLLDYAHDSFLGDEEDGPYAFQGGGE